MSDWQWRLCMSWSAPQVPPPERRQVQLRLYMAAGIKRQAAAWQAAAAKLKKSLILWPPQELCDYAHFKSRGPILKS